jgi:hypothetical protein
MVSGGPSKPCTRGSIPRLRSKFCGAVHKMRETIMFWSLLVLSVGIVAVLIAKSALIYILQQRAAKRGNQ